jgi:nucleoside-diphosphate-sugar epimerase
MDCTKARDELDWKPRYDSLETLSETVTAARDQGIIPWPGGI